MGKGWFRNVIWEGVFVVIVVVVIVIVIVIVGVYGCGRDGRDKGWCLWTVYIGVIVENGDVREWG